MASGPGVSKACDALDMWLAGGGTIRLWTVAPDYDGDPAGVESVPAGGAPTETFQPAVAGTSGQIAKAVTSGAVMFVEVPDASDDIVALSVHDPSDDSIIAINRAWVAPAPGWSAGESPVLDFVSVPFVPVS